MPAGTVKIFKKCSPNGRVYLYLGNREYVQVSCDWRSSGHVTTILISDWSSCSATACASPSPVWSISR